MAAVNKFICCAVRYFTITCFRMSLTRYPCSKARLCYTAAIGKMRTSGPSMGKTRV